MKRYSTIMSVLLTLALPVAGSCADASKAPEKADASVGSMSNSGQSKMMGMMGGATAAGGGPALNPAGKVVETMNAGGYTYANLESDGKKTWVAFPNRATSVGETLSFRNCMEMAGFQSKSLGRQFDMILFCGGPEVQQKTAEAPAAKKAPRPAGQKIKVDKASAANAYTVSEIFAKGAALNGKQVVVRGEVVKVASGIMDRNWIHLQDGTGDEKQKTHDLVITTDDMAQVGDVVTVTGTLAKDKDFGGGYKYGVIIEKGSVKK